MEQPYAARIPSQTRQDARHQSWQDYNSITPTAVSQMDYGGYVGMAMPENPCQTTGMGPVPWGMLSLKAECLIRQGHQQDYWGHCGKGVSDTFQPAVDRPTGYHSFLRWLMLSPGVSELEKALVSISATLEKKRQFYHRLRALQVEVSSLSTVGLQNQMALDLLMVKEGRVCTVIKVVVHKTRQKNQDRSWESLGTIKTLPSSTNGWYHVGFYRHLG